MGMLAIAIAAALLTLAPRWFRAGRDGVSEGHVVGPTYRGTIHAQPGARFLRVGSSPDEIVRLFEGRVTVQVQPLAAGERFRVLTDDAEVEVRGTAFEVSAEHDQLRAVWVLHGLVSVRGRAVHAPILLRAGQRWDHAEESPVPATPMVAETEGTTSPVARAARDQVGRPDPRPSAGHDAPARPSHTPVRRDASAAEPVSNGSSSTTAHEVPAPEPSATRVERRFREGWAAMRQGDFSRATAAFDDVLTEPDSPLSQDASYWRAVALARSGRGSDAAMALARFLHDYPTSARIGEAHAMLGWYLLREGDRSEARRHFDAALVSGSARGAASAERGLARLHAMTVNSHPYSE
ncbi:MAG: tetratricopeptide repeat protein [Deltaproteobacteria bacterium]|nr:tetratricopeptide repeat protein [Deltaproteobacteria bacterium]